ncbi:Metallo-dependent phosphatase-like protein [Thelephora terrestris]|uniref:Metallo-dependent phosphatase-like protein n=1 Tax=Thelephora terrestris TaxID=56493 RepID=A0A9P6HTI7_9AGAM|nr:Metallo-dependent phosphatase-like protein [Thelephora terrestris]
MLILSWLWLFIVLWFEIGVFYASVRRCNWPGQNLGGNHKNILIVADPQILDRHSYPERPSWLRLLSQIMTDLNMRKSWRAVNQRFRPDYVVFLGDMMDNGRLDMTHEEYEGYYGRFLGVFSAPKEKVYYAAGNHDVGLGSSGTFPENAVERYVSHFGPLNQVVQITAKYRLIIVDAPSLVDEDEERMKHGVPIKDWPSVGGPLEFIKGLSKAPGQEGVHNILITHIPLYRPPGTDCGPSRERGTIRAGRGTGYENTLSSEISEFLIARIRPVLVFSGDDHDYCEVRHQGGVQEVTVKSFSMAMGIRKPGFQLLSVPQDDGASTGAVGQLCLLPDQLGIYLDRYIPFVALTLGIMVVDLLLTRKTGMGSDRRAGDEGTILPLHKIKIMRPVVDWWVLRGLRRRRRAGRGLIGDFARYFFDVAGIPGGAFVLISIVFMVLL